MSNLITIQGTVEEIKRDGNFKDGKGNDKRTVVFVVSRPVGNKTHYYLLRAISNGLRDQFSISDMISHEVSAECYLNGRKSETANGPWYNNDLVVKSISTL